MENTPKVENPQGTSQGMTLRDYFAGQAIGAILSVGGQLSPRVNAEYAYTIADEMLKARAKS